MKRRCAWWLTLVLLTLSSVATADIGSLSPEEDAADLVLERADWAGFFPFSPEDGTAAVDLDGVVASAVAEERLRECGDVQEPITQDARDRLIGTRLDVIVDAVDGTTLIGRSHREAPEIDGVIQIPDAHGRPGARITVEVTDALGPDLIATPVLAGVAGR